MENKKFCIWLSSLPNIGSKTYSKLVNHFGSAKEVFNCSRQDLIESNLLNKETIDLVMTKRDVEKLDKYINKMSEHKIKVTTIGDDSYPFNLTNIYDPPPVLYIKGELIEEDINSIAVVGARKASEYGLKTAFQFGKEIAESGFTVVSGMALGIDSAAHKGALKAGGRTIAVFACGLNYVYPRSGLNLANEILKNGAIISEYPIGYKAIPQNFPARNRIISGMSKGVLIIEANKKSGSLITANFALEQGRDVFAIPGNINSPKSKGTNELIKYGAKLTDSISDILEEYYGLVSVDPIEKKLFINDLENRIVNLLKDSGKTADELIEEISTTEPSDVISSITLLEIQGVLKQINGIFYNS